MRVRAAYQHAEAVCDEKEVGNRDGVTIRLEQTLFIEESIEYMWAWNTHSYIRHTVSSGMVP